MGAEQRQPPPLGAVVLWVFELVLYIKKVISLFSVPLVQTAIPVSVTYVDI